MLEAFADLGMFAIQTLVVVVVQVNIIISMEEQSNTAIIGEELDTIVVVEETDTVVVDFGEEIEVIPIEMNDYNMVIDLDFEHTFSLSMLKDLDFESN